MGLDGKPVIAFTDLIAEFNRLQVVLVPVLWGEKQHHGNALNIHLPDSGTTWVFLNLDSNSMDFKFWMAHELGHALAPALDGEAGEDFADAFAQALLFPDAAASIFRRQLLPLSDIGRRVAKIRDEAAKQVISPWTIRRAIKACESAHGLDPLDLGADGPFMGVVKNSGKGYKSISQTLLGTEAPAPARYVACGRKDFDTPFFEALGAFCRAEEGCEHFICQVLGLPLADARALAEKLRT
jgi:hypothetical protein